MAATEHQLSASILHRNANLTHKESKAKKCKDYVSQGQVKYTKQMLNSDSSL